ncbi:MAG: DUF1289 domain-containing protein [Gammaproteobacteria bacterium]|nr:DUF1289 domain-containing protein [Gammaproteobacteria bacterium]
MLGTRKFVRKDSRSPCIRNCCLDDHDICLGCFRSVDEIMKWTQMSDEEQHDVLNIANQRKQKHKDKYSL